MCYGWDPGTEEDIGKKEENMKKYIDFQNHLSVLVHRLWQMYHNNVRY